MNFIHAFSVHTIRVNSMIVLNPGIGISVDECTRAMLNFLAERQEIKCRQSSLAIIHSKLYRLKLYDSIDEIK